MMKLVWFPQWLCQNYTFGKSYGQKCPYCLYSFDRASNRLIFDDKLTSPNQPASFDDLLGFFRVNSREIGQFLEISGGEPLIYPHLDRMLGYEGVGPGWTWAITSNTLATTMITRMIEACGGFLGGCLSWTASYHPLSASDELFERNIRLVAEHSRNVVKATVVISTETLPLLPHALDFLQSLPLARINRHMDTHRSTPEDSALLFERARAIIGDIHAIAGPPPKNILCAKRARLMAVGADGSVYECVTKCYQHLDPLGQANSTFRIADLAAADEACGLECFACCDHVKHLEYIRPGVEPITGKRGRIANLSGIQNGE